MEYTWEDIPLKEVEITSAESSMAIDRTGVKNEPEGTEKIDVGKQKMEPQSPSTENKDNCAPQDIKKSHAKYPYDDIFNLPTEF